MNLAPHDLCRHIFPVSPTNTHQPLATLELVLQSPMSLGGARTAGWKHINKAFRASLTSHPTEGTCAAQAVSVHAGRIPLPRLPTLE